MKVKELLTVYEDHYYTDVVIIDDDDIVSEEYGEADILATWEVKEHNHWYMGQLDYLSTIDPNPLEKWFDYKVKTFSMFNDYNCRHTACLYITI